MNCDECRELLSEYIDERLTASSAQAVASHLDECAGCRAVERDLRATVALLEGLETKAPPIDIAHSVAARMERDMLIGAPREIEKPKRALIQPIPFAGAGLAAAATFLAAFYLFHAPVGKEPAAALSGGSVATESYAPAAAQGSGTETAAAPAAQQATQRLPTEVPSAPSQRQSPAPGAQSAGKMVAGLPALSANASPPAGDSLAYDYHRDGRQQPDLREKAAVKDIEANRAERVRALGYLSDAPVAAKPSGATKVDAAYSMLSAAQTAQAGSAPVGAPQTAAYPRVAAAPRASVAQYKALEGREAAEERAPKDRRQLVAQVPQEETINILSTDSAITMAYELVKLLPSGGSLLPQGTLTVELLRYAAFQRGATVDEASDDKAVMEVTVDAATLDGIRAAFGAKKAAASGQTGLAANVPVNLGRDFKGSWTTADNGVSGGAARIQGASPTGPTDTLSTPAAAAKVRFTFERKVPALR